MRSIKPIRTKAIFGIIFLSIVSIRAISQEEQNNIIVEIQTDIDGEKKTFKKAYSSEAALHADEELKALQKETGTLNFSFPGGGNIELSVSDSSQNYVFSYDHRPDKTFNYIRVSKSLKENSALNEHLEIEEEDIVSSKELTIGSVDEGEFGKKGLVDGKNLLDLQLLSFYPNPSNGKFTLKFNFPEEDPLHIKIYNIEGQEVFVRYFPKFSGSFSETIDLRRQAAGIYLLEISDDKRRLTRRIMIQ